MYKIFAKKGTDEKVMIYCPNISVINETKKVLGRKYGGDWAYVDEFKAMDFLKFNDGMLYNGFDQFIDRYSSAILNIQEEFKNQ